MRTLLKPRAFAPAVVGLVLGGVAGGARFEQIDTREALCVSCHHGTSDADALDTPPHSETFSASCHVCHVLPIREYLSYTAIRVGAGVPSWVEAIDNPVVAQQSCLECHLTHGRGTTDCVRCHADGSKDIDITERCQACHHDQVMERPFEGFDCRNCHVEAFHDREDRVRTAMHDRVLGGSRPDREGSP